MTPHRTGRIGGLLHTVERIVYLRGLTGFGDVPPEALRPIANATVERTIGAGEVVGEQGEVPKSVHIIVEGAIELQTPGRPPVVQGPTSTVGFVPVFCGVARTSRAVATADTLTLEMDADLIFDMYEDPVYGFSLLMSGLRSVAGDSLDAAAAAGLDALPIVGAAGSAPSAVDTWVDRLLLLRSLPLFSGADPDALATFARTLQRVTIGADEPLWPHATERQPLFLVTGRVEGEHEAPCAIGLLEALAHRPPPSAKAITEVVALRGDVERLLDVMEDETSIGLGMIRSLIRVFLDAGLSD